MTLTLKLLLSIFFAIVASMVGANAFEYFVFGGLKGSLSSILLVGLGHVVFIGVMLVFIVLIWRKK